MKRTAAKRRLINILALILGFVLDKPFQRREREGPGKSRDKFIKKESLIMKIYEPSGQYGDNKLNIGKAKKSSSKRAPHEIARDKVNPMNFLKELDDATEEQVKKSLDQLIEELSQQAKILAEHRTFDELNKYKTLVKDFMKQAIQKIYSVKVSDSSKFMIKRKKVYIMVEMVDVELEKLTQKILNQHAETIEILSALDKIRGMLVDMYS